MFPAWLSKVLRPIGGASLILLLCVACAQQPALSNRSRPSIKIGVSLSLSGAFAAQGEALAKGYQLWADYVNRHGGLLGHSVQLMILSDASHADQAASNYLKLINTDHVDLVFGPDSTPLELPASVIANSYGYALLESAGDGPAVFDRRLRDIFDVSLTDDSLLTSFTQYLLSLPRAVRPKTAAYLFNDSFVTMPQVNHATLLLQNGGIHTAYYFIYPVETSAYADLADQVVQSHAQLVVLGTGFPDLVAFIQTFKQQHYNPQALVATGGPDQAVAFIKAIGSQSAEGVFVPQKWYPEAETYQNADFVQAYLAKFGGRAGDISPDAAGAFAAGQVMEQAIDKIKSFNNSALIQQLHSDTFNTVLGPAQFDSSGQNSLAQAYLFQWQRGRLIPVFPPLVAAARPEFPRPQWP